jgi:hypothetical protein
MHPFVCRSVQEVANNTANTTELLYPQQELHVSTLQGHHYGSIRTCVTLTHCCLQFHMFRALFILFLFSVCLNNLKEM